MSQSSSQKNKDKDSIYKKSDYLERFRREPVFPTNVQLKPDHVDLSYGLPDYTAFPEINDAYIEALAAKDQVYQYTGTMGHPRLLKALAEYHQRLFEREVDQNTEILVTPGTDNGIFLALHGLLSEGDEMILLEPFFSTYNMLPEMRGAKIVYVPLKPKPGANEKGYTTSADWAWDDARLEAAFTPKTKAIVICNPSNPLGKVFSIEELNKVASLCIKHNVVCISDEVYHGMVYEEGFKHTSIASLPGMWKRTLTLGSAGKLLGITGLKVGWIIGDERLIHLCLQLFLASVVVCPTLNQEVVAISIENELQRQSSAEAFLNRIKLEVREKRDWLVKQLVRFGIDPIVPEAGMFMMVDISQSTERITRLEDPDLPLNHRFARYMFKEGLGVMPCTLYISKSNEDHGKFVRICFFKTEKTLEKAICVLSSQLSSC